MTNELQTTDPIMAFRAIAADRLHVAADMSLHDLVDEFLRLTAVMEANAIVIDPDDIYRDTKLNDAGELASRERNIVTDAARARFGVSFAAYDSQF